MDRHYLVIWNGLAFLAFLTLFISSVTKGKLSWLLLTLPALLYFLFHALFTHFIHRYSIPLLPIFSICLIIFLCEIFKQPARRLATILTDRRLFWLWILGDAPDCCIKNASLRLVQAHAAKILNQKVHLLSWICHRFFKAAQDQSRMLFLKC